MASKHDPLPATNQVGRSLEVEPESEDQPLVFNSIPRSRCKDEGSASSTVVSEDLITISVNFLTNLT